MPPPIVSRGGAAWRARNFTGGGRIFEIAGRASKVGVGTPLDAGLDQSICTQLRKDPIGSSKLNYNLTATLEQPGFLEPLNTLTYAAFADRRSEFQVYLREEIGGSVTLRREGLRRIPMSLSYKISYGKTPASSANFCAFFSACTNEDIALLSQSRFLGTVTGTISLPRANSVLDPTQGYVLSAEGTLSSRFLGSSSLTEFAKMIVDGAWYMELSRDIVLSWHLRAGAIFAPQVAFTSAKVSFIPPDERFYAGGPNDVRGYQRNELGPVVYVVVVERPGLGPASLNQANTTAASPLLGHRRQHAGGGERGAPSAISDLHSADAARHLSRCRHRLRAGQCQCALHSALHPGRRAPLRDAAGAGPARRRLQRLPPAARRALPVGSPTPGRLRKSRTISAAGRRSSLTFQFAIGQPF